MNVEGIEKMFLHDPTGRWIKNQYGRLEWRYCPGSTIEIVDIEVSGDSRRQGIGRWLVERLFEEAEKLGVTCVYAITRYDNLVAQHFYEALLFNVCGVLRRFYDPDTKGVDAILYARSPKGPI